MSGEFKNCPVCGRLIMADATICKHCGANLLANHVNANNNANNSNTNNKQYNDEPIISGDAPFSFGEAFTYMFTDEKIFVKALTMIILFFTIGLLSASVQPEPNANLSNINVPNIIVSVILMIVSSLILTGYNISCIRSVIHQNGQYSLPYLSFGRNFVDGFKFLIGIYLFIFVVGIPIALLSLIPVLNIIVIIGGIIFSIIILYRMPAYSWIFANKPMFTIFFKFKLAGEVIKQDSSRYNKIILYFFFEFLLLMAFIAFVILIGLFLFKNISFGLYMIFAAIYSVYINYVNSYFFAKSISRKSLNLL